MALDADILALDALTLRDRIASGALTTTDVTEAYLTRIATEEPQIEAFAWHDPAFVRAQAQALDHYRSTGKPLGALHGVPVAIKDVIDTAKIPTEFGCALEAGRIPVHDATLVSRLKSAGAVILGKTVTTELQFLDASPTRNPHNIAHTPGGSSAGSAAAVAAAMTPLAIGTQTGGSVIRPAAYCGVTGFKPTFGTIPRTGVLSQAPSLDTVGVLARTPIEAALLAEVLYGYDPGDPATAVGPAPKLLGTARCAPPLKPVFAFVRGPGWAMCDAATKAGFAELCDHLGDQVFEAPLPNAFDEAEAQRRIVNQAEMARTYYGYGKHRDQLGPNLRAALDAGDAILARDYLAALDWRGVLYAGLEEIFERCDAILTPAAPSAAPEGLDSTGSPVCNGIWTFTGVPAVTLPLLSAESGLPIGVQLVGPRHGDGRLLRSANWLWSHLAEGHRA